MYRMTLFKGILNRLQIVFLLFIGVFAYNYIKNNFLIFNEHNLYTVNTKTYNYNHNHNHINKINEVNLTSNTMIKVKIFPHLKDYPPHQKDTVLNKLQITSNLKCKVYEGLAKSTAKTQRLLTITSHIKINALRLKKSLWIECPQGFYLTRYTPKVESYSYSGFLYVTSLYNKDFKQKYLLAVNVVELEEYLKGVVPSEILSHWPKEALKAQAVAARTYALFHINYARNYLKNSYYDLDDTIAYQVYTGLSYHNLNTNFAVNSTQNEVLIFNGSLIQAFYHADSGGQIVDAKKVFKLDIPYTQNKKELYDFKNLSEYSWKKTISLKEISDALIHNGILKPNQYIIDINIHDKQDLQDFIVKKLILSLNDGSEQYLSIEMLKQIVFIPSSKFKIKKLDNFKQNEHQSLFVEFIGLSMGHGVGMSQKGAKILADKYSYNYKQILDFYYKDTRLCQYSVYTDKLLMLNLCNINTNF